jgi:hypothetical protein
MSSSRGSTGGPGAVRSENCLHPEPIQPSGPCGYPCLGICVASHHQMRQSYGFEASLSFSAARVTPSLISATKTLTARAVDLVPTSGDFGGRQSGALSHPCWRILRDGLNASFRFASGRNGKFRPCRAAHGPRYAPTAKCRIPALCGVPCFNQSRRTKVVKFVKVCRETVSKVGHENSRH